MKLRVFFSNVKRNIAATLLYTKAAKNATVLGVEIKICKEKAAGAARKKPKTVFAAETSAAPELYHNYIT